MMFKKKEKKITGLLLTKEIRTALYLDVEKAIRCHTSAMERELKEREKMARKERMNLYTETEKVCERMTETRAKDILFSKYGIDEIIELWEEWKPE